MVTFPGLCVITSYSIHYTKLYDAIDVWENEPHIDLELLQQVWMATPHIAGYSQDGKANGTMMSVQAISQKFDLGLDDWKPTDIPQPPNSEILLDCKGLTDEEISYNFV